MKRLIALLLVIGSLLSILAGCGAQKTQGVSMGQWLAMINETFGMDSYNQEEPYFSNLNASNTYFEEVQIAVEWDVIDASETIDVDGMITWKEALLSLVNVGGFVAEDTSDDDKLDYAIEHFDNSIRSYWMSREISYIKAVVLLATAHEQWAKETYEDRVENITYSEGVTDLTGNTDIAENYVILDDMTVIPEELAPELQVGDVYILPGNEDSMGTKIYKVEEITSEDGVVYITNSEDVDLYDIAEEIFMQETLAPTGNNTVFYDANGNVLSNDSAQVIPQNAASSDMGVANLSSGGSVQTLGDAKIGHTFPVEVKINGKKQKLNVSLSYKLDGALDLEFAVESDNETGWNWEVSSAIDNLKITNKVDYKWFQLRSATVKVDYESSVGFKVSTEKELVDKVFAPYNNGSGKGLTNLKNAILKDKKPEGDGAQTIKLFSIDVYSIGVARVCLDVNLIVKVDGSFEVKITSYNTKGIEYKNKNLRFINTCDKDIDFTAEAKIEATLGVGPALYIANLKKKIVGVQASIGAGARASVTVHLVDSENHLIEEATAEDFPPEVYAAMVDAEISTDVESIMRAAESQGGTYSTETSGEIKLHVDVCINIALYWIVRVELAPGSYIEDLLGSKVKLSKEFLGEKNAKFAYIHVENFDFITGFSNAVFGSKASSADQCTKKFTPFTGSEETVDDETSDSNNDAIVSGEQLILAEMYASVTVGQKYYTIVQQIPQGYTAEDLRIKVEDTSIASVDENGVVTGLKAGSTIITVYTSDNQYAACCALSVTEMFDVELDPL